MNSLATSSPHRRIASNLLWSPTLGFVRNPVVEVDANGLILSLEQWSEVDRTPLTEFYGGVMAPGFVNAHCHLELSYLSGAIEPHKGFAHFAQSMAAVRGGFSEAQRMDAMVRADKQLFRNGVAGVGDISNDTSSYEIKSRSAVDYHTFVELFGLGVTSIDRHVDMAMDDRHTLTPHSLYSVNQGVMEQIARHAKAQSVPLSIHFMESPAEAELFEGRGRLYDWFRAAGMEYDFGHFDSPTHRLVESFDPDQSLLLVHNCCVTRGDVEAILSHFRAPIYWVVCPSSNDYISGGLRPPIELLRDMGCRICIGTDSLASSISLSMVDQWKLLGSGLPLDELLTWSCANGAAALGMSHLGEIAVGRSCGINIISGIDYSTMTSTPSASVFRVV